MARGWGWKKEYLLGPIIIVVAIHGCERGRYRRNEAIGRRGARIRYKLREEMAVNFSSSPSGPGVERKRKFLLDEEEEEDRQTRRRERENDSIVDRENGGELLLADLACERAILHVARQLEHLSMRGDDWHELWERWTRGQQRGWIDGDYRSYIFVCYNFLARMIKRGLRLNRVYRCRIYEGRCRGTIIYK